MAWPGEMRIQSAGFGWYGRGKIRIQRADFRWLAARLSYRFKPYSYYWLIETRKFVGRDNRCQPPYF